MVLIGAVVEALHDGQTRSCPFQAGDGREALKRSPLAVSTGMLPGRPFLLVIDGVIMDVAPSTLLRACPKGLQARSQIRPRTVVVRLGEVRGDVVCRVRLIIADFALGHAASGPTKMAESLPTLIGLENLSPDSLWPSRRSWSAS